MTESPDFRDFLNNELARRKTSNRSYSLRMFAKFLSVDPSFLAKLLKKQRNATIPMISKVGGKIGLNADQIDAFKMSFIRSPEKSGSLKNKGARKVKFNDLSASNAESILYWHSFAIMELLTIPSFTANLKNIASTFGIDEEQIFRTLSSLENIGLVRRDSKGVFHLIKLNNSVLPTARDTTEDLKKLQIQLHLKSISSIESLPVEERDHTGIFMAIPSNRIPEAKKLIKSFRRKFMNIMQKPGERDCVYYLGNSFFPLCKVSKK